MKHKTAILILSFFGFFSIHIHAQYKDKPLWQKHQCRCCESKTKTEFFEKKINKLKEDGVITEQEEKELLDAINDVKLYREQVWSDDKLTKEEQQNLSQKEKALREKIRTVMDKAREYYAEEKTIQEKEKFFNEKIDKLLKDKKITKNDADELKKQHKELLQLEEKIWSDNVMTKEEQQKLTEERKKFNKKLREVFWKKCKNKIKHQHKWKKCTPHIPPTPPEFEPERGKFPDENFTPPILPQELGLPEKEI
ncbi:MAG: hypothetical protein N2555_02800 [Endomicrobia bacterium]|nr:hypothetical protein [Endomicrobiia bacterium]